MRFCHAIILVLIAATASLVRADAEFSPYAPDSQHLWNRLHNALFVRSAGDTAYVHSTDPFLYRDSTFLLEGDSHKRAIAVLDEFNAAHFDANVNVPDKRFLLQHDLWAVFDYAVGATEWQRPARLRPEAQALRDRAARAVAKLLLSDEEIAHLPDNYALAIRSDEFAADDDPRNADHTFLPADLFDPNGPWVRVHNRGDKLTSAPVHFGECEGRAAHLVFLRLPGGRAVTEKYLAGLSRAELSPIPVGTAVALVRRPLVITTSHELRVAPITEMVQLRVYRRVSHDDDRNRGQGFPKAQSVHQFLLDRAELLAARHGLREITSSTAADFFGRGDDVFRGDPSRAFQESPLAISCIGCHAQPGAESVLSIKKALRGEERGKQGLFGEPPLDTELSYTIQTKAKRPEWKALKTLLDSQ